MSWAITNADSFYISATNGNTTVFPRKFTVQFGPIDGDVLPIYYDERPYSPGRGLLELNYTTTTVEGVSPSSVEELQIFLEDLILSGMARDYYTEVALGNVPGRSIMNALGERESMGTTTTGEDIWRGNELTPAPTSTTSIPHPDSAGEQMTVVSEAADDASGGTGVRTLRIEYLDASGDEQTEDITMNGTTPVNTVATNIRFVNDMYSLTVGSAGVAVGHIKIYKTGSSGLVYNMIHEGGNKSLVPNRMVPNGKKLVLKEWTCAEAQNIRVAFRIRSTDMGGTLIPDVFCFKGTQYISDAATGDLSLNIEVPALSIVKVSGWADVAGAEGSCSWWGELIDV